MLRKVWFGLVFGLVAMMLVGVTVNGCAKVEEAAKKILSDPGLIAASKEASTISGSVSYSGGTISVNLNAIIISGEAKTGLDSAKFNVYVGKSGTATSEWKSVDITIPTDTARPMDMVFLMDNTGSMAPRIRAVKDSIIAFAASLEAAGADVKYGVVSFGDVSSESESLSLPATAEAVKAWLDALSGVGGGDSPENPLDAIMLAFNTFSWRSGAQKVFIVITDNPCHQLGDGGGDAPTLIYDVASVEAALIGKATVYAVSPKIDVYSTYPRTFYTRTTTEGDVRWLADGYGWFNGIASTLEYGTVKPYYGTGGKWVEIEPDSTAAVDLTTLGISTLVTKGYSLRFSYTFDAGTWYIHILADTDGDGVMDSDVVLAVTVTSSGAVVPMGVVSSKPFVPAPNN